MITRDIFEQGATWSDWLRQRSADRERWAERYAAEPDADAVDAFRRLPESRSIACLVGDDCVDSLGTVPHLARACEEAGRDAVLDLRIFRVREHPELRTDVLLDGRPTTPLVAIFDAAWHPVSRWGPRPLGARRLVVTRRGRVAAGQLQAELDRWYQADAGASTLREVLPALRGDPIEERRAMENLTRYLLHFAEAEDG